VTRVASALAVQKPTPNRCSMRMQHTLQVPGRTGVVHSCPLPRSECTMQQARVRVCSPGRMVTQSHADHPKHRSVCLATACAVSFLGDSVSTAQSRRLCRKDVARHGVEWTLLCYEQAGRCAHAYCPDEVAIMPCARFRPVWLQKLSSKYRKFLFLDVRRHWRGR
jgi:hypothetical protein